MKKLIILSGIAGFIVFSGCNNDKTKNVGTEEISTEQQQINAGAGNSDSNQSVITTQQVGVPADQSGMQGAAPTASGMNPAHGEPGHRCDIAVGEPLNSPPGKNAPATPTMINVDPNKPADNSSPNINPSQIQTIPVPASSGTTPPGMNPPHGEPGHNCDLPVGAPLKK